ncbi:hypothetical protein AMTRI_Chr02g265300 [Amborella trichopoda]
MTTFHSTSSALYKGLARYMLFRALLFYFVVLCLLRRFLWLHCSSTPMAQVNIIEVPEKKDIAVSNSSLALENVFYLPLSKWKENNNTWGCMNLAMIATIAKLSKGLLLVSIPDILEHL